MEKVQISTPSIKLNSLLKLVNVASSGGEAKSLIVEGEVKVNGEITTIVRKQIFPGDTITINNEEFLIAES